MKDRKEYMKAWRESHKEDIKSYQKAYIQAHKEEMKAKAKAYYQATKEQRKEYFKAWRESHKEYMKTWYAAHKEHAIAYAINYMKNDVNSFGESKNSIRKKSQRYLNKYGTKIPGYQIHHCCTYDDPTKFIYCSKEMHNLIHAYLRQHNLDADSDHYKYIKHILDDTVVKYNIDD